MRNKRITWGVAIAAIFLGIIFVAGVAVQRIWMDGAEWQMRRAAAPYELRRAKKAASRPKPHASHSGNRTTRNE